MTETDTTPTRKRRPRVSLLNLLLLMTVVAALLAVWCAMRENDRMRLETIAVREQMRAMQLEYGAFVVEDPKLVYVAPLPREKPLASLVQPWEWGWRVYVPEGPGLRLSYLSGARETKGRAAGTFSKVLAPGTHTVSVYYFRKHPAPGETEPWLRGWTIDNSTLVIDGGGADWLESHVDGWGQRKETANIRSVSNVSTFPPEESITLYDYEVDVTDYSERVPDAGPEQVETRGFRVWLEPMP
ncbi:hypothetical protein Mal64_10100 [Pseudobythopirellula maris]|uniref:Uncharacterized protein n=1 Tax=Pseudobythopirellula maris TaxID=2527991 RepID=A0A5C5ZTT7_9BACT|nr:hypothetical protein [Pseudobythopirellula maris]TWT90616.1 hypothetical protein Mal64_10100 [Pseudobythopirellula maris]